MWRTSWRECDSPGCTPCRPPAASCNFLQTSSSFLHSHQFLLGQLPWLLCFLVLTLVVGAPRWQVFIFLVLCTVLQFWAVLLLLLLLCGYEFKIDRNVSKEEYSHSQMLQVIPVVRAAPTACPLCRGRKAPCSLSSALGGKY